MSDDRLFGFIALLCVLLWVGSGQLGNPRLRRLAQRAAVLVLIVGLALALLRLVEWWVA
jgi:hypothetical protein